MPEVRVTIWQLFEFYDSSYWNRTLVMYQKVIIVHLDCLNWTLYVHRSVLFRLISTKKIEISDISNTQNEYL